MKKLKFLSSLTLASVIVSGVAITSLASGTSDWTGVLKQGSLNLVKDKDVVGLLLSDKGDTVKVDELLDVSGYTGIKLNSMESNADASEILKTGYYYTANNKDQKRHVVVYNDVDKDGKATMSDVVYALDILTGNVKDASDLQKEAANVEHKNKEFNMGDVTRMLDFQTGVAKTPVDPVPEGIKDVEEFKYDIKVNNNNVINSKNLPSSTVTISLKSGSVKENNGVELQLRYVGADGKDENNVLTGNQSPIKINKYGTAVEVTGVNFESAKGADVKKDLTVRLYDKTGKVLLGETVVKINTHTPEAAVISARRENSSQGYLSFKGLKDSDIVKAYYKVSDSEITQETEIIQANGSLVTGAGKFEGLNNACDNKLLETELTGQGSHKVYFIVEDSVGNRSSKIYNALIPTDNVVIGQENPPKGDDNKGVITHNDTTFTWDETANNNKYTVRVYKDGELIKEYLNEQGTSKDLSSDMTETGTYKIEVVVQGNIAGTTSNSNPLVSDEVTVSKLSSVKDVVFTAAPKDNTKATLSWSAPETKNEQAYKYVVTVQKYNGGGADINLDSSWEDEASYKEQEVNINELKLDLEDLTPNTLYRAKVYVKAKTTQHLVKDSEPVSTTKKFFTINAQTIFAQDPTATDTTLTFKPTIPDTLGNIEFTFDMEIYTDTDDDLVERTSEKRYGYKLNDKGELVIDNLQPGKNYKFVFTLKSGDAEGKTTLDKDAAPDGDTLLTAPVVKGIVTKSEKTAKENADRVYVSDNILYINKTKYDLTNTSKYYDPDKILDIAKILIPQLGENDQLISITKNAETGKIEASIINGTQAKTMSLNMSGVTLDTLKVAGNDWEQKIGTLSGISNLILTDGDFDITGISGVNITLEEGARVKGVSTGVTLAKNANVRVNGVDIHTTEGAELTDVSNQTFTFVPSEKETSAIEITNNSGSDVTVTFSSAVNTGNRQLGKVTITSTNAKVTLTTTGTATVKDVNVSTTDGNVEIKEAEITGNTDVTVTASREGTNTIVTNINYEGGAPFKLTKLLLRNYSDDELKGTMSEVDSYQGSNSENVKKLKDYLNKFSKLFGRNITISVEKESNEITLTMPKGSTSISTSDIADLFSKPAEN